MGNSSVQITRPSWITQETDELDLAERGLGEFVVPGRGPAASISAHRPAPHALSDDAVREAPTSLSLPGERVGAPTPPCRIPLFACIVQCAAHFPGHVCVSAPVSGIVRICWIGHTLLPTDSILYLHLIKGRSPK